MNTNTNVNFYPENIEDFKQFLYIQDSDQFVNILISDIKNNIFESMIDLIAQVPFLKKNEYKKLESCFNSKKILRMTSKKFEAPGGLTNKFVA